MKSKTKISKQAERKFNPELVETINLAKKNSKWLEVAKILSQPRRKRININISYIDENSKQGETILIPGKILSQGEISKKIKVVAFNFSEKSKEKLLSKGCEVLSISEEIKLNPEMKGVKILNAGIKIPTLSKTGVFNK